MKSAKTESYKSTDSAASILRNTLKTGSTRESKHILEHSAIQFGGITKALVADCSNGNWPTKSLAYHNKRK